MTSFKHAVDYANRESLEAEEVQALIDQLPSRKELEYENADSVVNSRFFNERGQTLRHFRKNVFGRVSPTYEDLDSVLAMVDDANDPANTVEYLDDEEGYDTADGQAQLPSIEKSRKSKRARRQTIDQLGKSGLEVLLRGVPRHCPNKPHFDQSGNRCLNWPEMVRLRENETDTDHEDRLKDFNFKNIAAQRHAGRFTALTKFQPPLKQRVAAYRVKKTMELNADEREGAVATIETIVAGILYFFVLLYRAFQSLLRATELWSESLRLMERRFGTAVFYFFKFAKWLILLNFYAMLIYLGCLVIPQAIHGTPPQDPFRVDELISGAGHLYNSTLFIGAYSNTKIDLGGHNYDIPLAYIVVTIAFFIVHLISSIMDMGHRHQEHAEKGGDDLYPYSTIVFSAWEHSVNFDKPAKQQERIGILLSETLQEDTIKEQESKTRGFGLFIRRIIINILVLGILAGYLTGLYLLAEAYQDSESFIESYATSFTATLGSTLLPMLFWSLSSAERWHNPAVTVKFASWRSWIVKIASLYVLIFRIFDEAIETPTNPATECWETLTGQEVYRLALMNFLFTVLTTFGGDCGRFLLKKYPKKWLEWLVSWSGPPTFQMAKSTLDVINCQAILWTGVFFSPLLTVVTVLAMFFIFWSKYASARIFLETRKMKHLVDSDDPFTYWMFVLTLFVTAGPTVYASLNLEPSTTCGPFSGQPYAWKVFSTRVNQELPRVLRLIIEFLGTSGFAVISLILLLLSFTYLLTMSNAASSMQRDLQVRLMVQQEEKKALVNHLGIKLKRRSTIKPGFQRHTSD